MQFHRKPSNKQSIYIHIYYAQYYFLMMMRPTPPSTNAPQGGGGGGGGMCTVCKMYLAGSGFAPAMAVLLAAASTTVPCTRAPPLVCVHCCATWERKIRKNQGRTKQKAAAAVAAAGGGGKMVQCATCQVWKDFATDFYKKEKRHYKSMGTMTCSTCRRLQCKYKKLLSRGPSHPPPPAMATTLPLSAAGAIPGNPYETHCTPFLGHHPDHTNDYDYDYQHPQPPPQPQYLPAAPVYYHYYAPAHFHRHHEQVPTTTTTPWESRKEEEGGGWNSATTQLQQQPQSRQPASSSQWSS